MALYATLLGAGKRRVSWTISEPQRGCCRHPLCTFRRNRLIKHIPARVVWGPPMLTEFQLLVLNTVVIAALVTQFLVWGPLPMLSEFQLWILSTIVMVALVVVCVALPG